MILGCCFYKANADAVLECDANQALKKIYRVVKPGGAIGFVVHAIDKPPRLISPSGVTDKSLYSRVANANFRNLMVFPYFFSQPEKPIQKFMIGI